MSAVLLAFGVRAVLLGGVAGLAAIAVRVRGGRTVWTWALAAACVWAAHDLTTAVAADLGRGSGVPGVLDWDGALAGLAFGGVALLALFHGRLHEAGVRLALEPGSLGPGLAASGMLIAAAVAAAAVFPGGGPRPELIAFATLQAVGLELVYRGVLLGAFDRAWPGRANVLGASMGWGAVVSSVAYGAAATTWFGATPLLAPLFASIAIGLVLCWLRARTGGLVFPTLAHAGGAVALIAI